MIALPLYLLIGAFAGFSAGLLGIGGGLVVVPALALLWRAQGWDESLTMHLAVGTSLAVITVTSISSMLTHHRRGAVQWPLFRRLAPGMVVGAVIGAGLAAVLPATRLRMLFGVFELVIAAQLIFAPRLRQGPGHVGAAGMRIAGALIGAISAALGVGGGTLTVPWLLWTQVAIHNAVATAAACGLPIALAGAAAFMFYGHAEPSLPAASIGFVYLPAFVAIALTSVACAPLGARLAHALPGALLRRIFGVLLALVGARLLLA